METKVLTAHLPVALADKVEEMATRLERSKGWIVKQALAAWIDVEEERHRLTLDALASVNAGDVVDHAQVRVWAKSLATKKPLPVPKPKR